MVLCLVGHLRVLKNTEIIGIVRPFQTMAAIAGSSLKTRLFNMGIQSKMAELQR